MIFGQHIHACERISYIILNANRDNVGLTERRRGEKNRVNAQN